MTEPRIVVVEDHVFTNQLLVKMLNRHFQLKCLPFTDADRFTEWLNTAESVEHTIYLLDIILSENPMAKNGIDLATDVVNFTDGVSIVILTGCPLNEDIRGKIKVLKDRGICISLFEKPVDADRLLHHVETIMEKDSNGQGETHGAGFSETDS